MIRKYLFFLFFESGRVLVNWRRNFNNIKVHEEAKTVMRESEGFATH
jgi:hypothetical protein